MIIDGKAIAEEIIGELEVEARKSPAKKVCFVSFATSPATRSFVAIKSRVAERLGVHTTILEEEAGSTEEAVAKLGEILKGNYDGIVIQLPLPAGVDAETLFNTLPPEVDIDRLKNNTDTAQPVAQAVEEILNRHNVDLANKNILILGRGKLVGEPVSAMFDKRNVTYNTADKDTPEEEKLNYIKQADIIISGMGLPHYLKPEMLKLGVVIIDAGTSGDQGMTKGDADPGCADVASLFTPVPGGLGPITVACLFRNLYRS
jgi:methylenetetrahydrofolate dehydrogenase (NADP+)/methenyltetrahydrofolate cyclohydrolase